MYSRYCSIVTCMPVYCCCSCMNQSDLKVQPTHRDWQNTFRRRRVAEIRSSRYATMYSNCAQHLKKKKRCQPEAMH